MAHLQQSRGLLSRIIGETSVAGNILFLPPAIATAESTWEEVLCHHEELFDISRMNLHIYDPIHTTGFYFNGSDRSQLDDVICKLNSSGRPLLVAGGSMGGFGAIHCYRRLSRMICGVYAVSPIINPLSAYHRAMESGDNILAGLAADMLFFVGGGNVDRLHEASIIDQLIYFSRGNIGIVVGDQDFAIGTLGDHLELRDAMMCGGGFYMSVPNGTHDGKSVWSFPGMIAFARALFN